MKPRNSWSGFRVLIGVAAGLIVAATLAIGMTVWWLRSQAISDSSKEVGNLAFVLAEQLNRSLQSIELILGDLQEKIQASGVKNADELRRLLKAEDTHQMLVERKSRVPHASLMSIVDKDGWVISSSIEWPVRPTNLSDRAHFQYLKTHNDQRVHISDPILDRLRGVPAILFIKRLNDADQNFIGMIVVGIRLSYFNHIYESLAKMRDLSFMLLRTNGTVLIRYPDVKDRAGEGMPTFSPWYRLVAEGGGHYRSPGYFDGIARQVAVRPLPDYSLVVNVAVSENAALAVWRIQAISIGAGTFIIVSCLIFLLQAVSRQFTNLAVSERRLLQKSVELEQANVKVEAALNNMSQGLAMFDRDRRLIVCNKRYTEVYDLPAELSVPGTPQAEILKNRIARGVYAGGDPNAYMQDRITIAREGKAKSSILELSNGRFLFVCHQPTEEGGWVSTHEDITERRRAEAKIDHMARHDGLTDLPNRLFFREQLEECLKRVHRGERLAVLYLDVDQFKTINDTLGHSLGDELLKAVAARLRSCLRDTDLVSRLGGDEFAIIQTAVTDTKDIIALVDRMFEAVRAPYDFDGRELTADISVGISVAPGDGSDPDQLLRNADLAMYKAKADGRGTYRFFEAEMEHRVKARLALEFELRHAIMGEEFALFYQPILDLRSNEIAGCEALVRWHHPKRGLVAPGEFIPLLEETGLINMLGEWVLKTACADAASWPSNIKVAVNVSPVQFKAGNVVPTVLEALGAAKLAADRLDLEITEAVFLRDDEEVLQALHQLRELGVQIAMDDFGTGYSSLSYLRRFPFDKIKIDRSFIKDVSESEKSRTIVDAVVSIANASNIATVAEGVETEQQMLALRRLGCSQLQGFLFSRPIAAAETLRFVSRSGRRKAFEVA